MYTKICSKCKRELPLDKFFKCKQQKSNLTCWCKDCKSEYQRLGKRKDYCKEYREKNRERILQQFKEIKKRPMSMFKTRLNTLRKRYNLSGEDLVEMLDSQKGCCDICGDSLIYLDTRKLYAVDHNHTTGKVRGLLCSKCNLAIGYVDENKDVLMKAIKYLEKHNNA